VLPEHATFGGTIRAAEQSLRRLRLEYLDLYLLHWPSHHPIEDTMRAMEALVDAGKIRFFGVSNFDLEALRVAAMHLQRHRLACNQVLYNLTHRGIDHDLVPWCRERGIAVVGYTPFGGLPRAGGNGAQALAAVAARYGKTVRQVVLRYLTREPHVFTIPKASTPEHVRDNAGAADFTLADADIAEIDRAFPAPRRGVPLATS